MLDRMGILAEPDALALELLCEAYADYLAAARELKDFGSAYYETTTEKGGTMYRAHPALAAKADADRRIRGWLAEFGLTPSSRSRVKTDGSKEDDDPLAKYG
jgi:P27 family predicted phage terminase small subunit